MKTSMILLAVLVAASGILGGCGHELFTDANNDSSERRIGTFYDGDSAVQTRESRQKASDNGFGYPAGLLQQ